MKKIEKFKKFSINPKKEKTKLILSVVIQILIATMVLLCFFMQNNLIVTTKSYDFRKINSLSMDIGSTSGYVTLIDSEGNGTSAVEGTYTLQANGVYYAYIAGGEGGADTYTGGNGGYQKIKITVGSSDVTLSYKVGGKGEYSTNGGGGYPDGQAGLGSGGGGGSTQLYINNTVIAAAAGGGGGGQKTPGLGGTGTGSTYAGGLGQTGENNVTVTHNGTNGILWSGDTIGAGYHYNCDPDGGGGGRRLSDWSQQLLS